MTSSSTVLQMNKKIQYSVLVVCGFIFWSYLFQYNAYMTNSLSAPDSDNFENNCHFVSSRGIMKSCDVFPSSPVSSTQMIDFTAWTVQNNDVIYIQGSALKDFIKNMLPRIKCNFTLVTGDCDESMPNEVLSFSDFKEFVNDYRLKHWFSQNLVMLHEKMSIIPIGMDYHSIFHGIWWSSERKTAMSQEHDLMNILNSSPEKRLLKCYANFHVNSLSTNVFSTDREIAKREIPAHLVDFENTHVSRIETWKKQILYHFVISPHGNGLDCHRTWEALILGNIPVVRHSHIDNLFEDLPVLIVSHWYEVTENLLIETLRLFKKRKWKLEKLTLEYWMAKIRAFET